MYSSLSFILDSIFSVQPTLEVSDFVNEGTPVPIPNTVVKLIYVDNTWLEAAREDRSSLTLKTVSCNSVTAYCQ